MALPSSEVVIAIFDSYLNIRKYDWSLNEKDPAKSKLQDKSLQKMIGCMQCVKKMAAANSAEDWLAIHNEMLNLQKSELQTAISARQRFFGFSRFFVDRPLMLETLCAANSYVSSFFQADQLNTKEFEENIKQVNQLTGRKGTIENYCDIYFTDIIKIRDPLAHKLSEQSFADFEKHAQDNTRKSLLCNKFAASSVYANDSANKSTAAAMSLLNIGTAVALGKEVTPAIDMTSSSSQQKRVTRSQRRRLANKQEAHIQETSSSRPVMR